MGMGVFQTLIEVADSVVGGTVYHTGERKSHIMSGVGPFLIAADAFLSEQVGICAGEA